MRLQLRAGKFFNYLADLSSHSYTTRTDHATSLFHCLSSGCHNTFWTVDALDHHLSTHFEPPNTWSQTTISDFHPLNQINAHDPDTRTNTTDTLSLSNIPETLPP